MSEQGTTVTIALDKEIIANLDKMAADDLRNRSSMIRLILIEGVRHRLNKPAAGVSHRAPARRPSSSKAKRKAVAA